MSDFWFWSLVGLATLVAGTAVQQAYYKNQLLLAIVAFTIGLIFAPLAAHVRGLW